jgi:hypothetical protein
MVEFRAVPRPQSLPDDRTVIASQSVTDVLALSQQQQVRVERPGDAGFGDFTSAVYTVQVTADFDLGTAEDALIMWFSPAGLERINASEGWLGSVRPYATNPTYQSGAEGQKYDEYVGEYIRSDTDLFVCAPYGGDIYKNTDVQAVRIASELSQSAWIAKGYNRGGGARDRWYIDPTLIHPQSYASFGDLVDFEFSSGSVFGGSRSYDQADYGLLLTGMERDGIIIGGLAPDSLTTLVNSRIREKLALVGADDISVRVARSGEYAGNDVNNIANRVSEDSSHGIQIAQGPEVLRKYWKVVADAVIEAYEEFDEY